MRVSLADEKCEGVELSMKSGKGKFVVSCRYKPEVTIKEMIDDFIKGVKSESQ